MPANESLVTPTSKELKVFDSLKQHIAYSKTALTRDTNDRLVITFTVRFPVKIFESDLKSLAQLGLRSFVINKDNIVVTLKPSSVKEDVQLLTFKELINKNNFKIGV